MTNLSYLIVIFLYLVAIVLASFMFLRKHFVQKNKAQTTLFLLFVFLFLSVIFSFLSRFVDLPTVAAPPAIALIVMSVTYTLMPTVAALWMLYIINLIYLEEAPKSFRIVTTIILVVNMLLSFLSMIPSLNLFFTLENGIYSRGHLFLVNYYLTFSFYIAALVIIILKWRRFGKRRTPLFVSMIISPAIGLLLQNYIPEFPFSAMGSTLSFAIVAMNIQYVHATTDYLTGLRNRRSLTNYLAKKINSIKESTSFSILMFDIDNFKAINDTHGHLVGDEALRHIGMFLEANHLTGDFIARFGGDEFIIVTDKNDPDELKDYINEMRSGFEKDIAPRFTNSPLSFSVGYITFTKDSTLSNVDILTRIDALMYQDKRTRKTKLQN